MIRSRSKSWLANISVPLISIALGFVVGAILMLLFGYNPIIAYDAMLRSVFTSPYFMGEALRQATILTFTGLSFALADKAGFFNIGISGQLLMGWLASIWAAQAFSDLPRLLLVPLAFLAGTLAGAVWSGIAGFLRAYFGTNEVVVTIMLNYTALHTVNYIIRSVLTNGANTTEILGDNASVQIGWLTSLTQGSRLNLGIFLALIVVFLYWFYLNHTTSGFEVRAVGLNEHASQYAGMSAKKNIIISMVLSGALAGVGGAIHGLGTFGNIFTQTALPAEGFNGIAVGLLGLGNPVGIFLSSVLFGVLDVGAAFMPNRAGVPDELATVIIASIIFFVGSNYIIRYFMNKRKARKEEAARGGEAA